ncbi:MAG: hypothetical protein WCK48_00825 [bacterium]
MLGEPSRHIIYPGGTMEFVRALYESMKRQDFGFPYDPQPHIKYVLREVRSHFAPEERNLVVVFLGINRPADLHGADCFFYYRGTVVTMDLTLRHKKPKHETHLIFRDELLGKDGDFKFICKFIACVLKKHDPVFPIGLATRINTHILGGYQTRVSDNTATS